MIVTGRTEHRPEAARGPGKGCLARAGPAGAAEGANAGFDSSHVSPRANNNNTCLFLKPGGIAEFFKKEFLKYFDKEL